VADIECPFGPHMPFQIKTLVPNEPSAVSRVAELEAENAQLRSDLAAVTKARDGFRDAMRERSRR